MKLVDDMQIMARYEYILQGNRGWQKYRIGSVKVLQVSQLIISDDRRGRAREILGGGNI